MRNDNARPSKEPNRAMNNTSGPIRHKAEELLADGEWHNYEKIVHELMRMVPPGFAARTAERSRRSSGGITRAHVRPAARKRPIPVDEQIRIGARIIARGVLKGRSRISLPWTEIFPVGRIPDPSIRMIRKTPKEVMRSTHH